MVSPEGGVRYAKAVSDLYGDAVVSLLNVVARRLAKGIDEPGWAEAKLTELLGLRADTMRVLAGLDHATPEAVAKALDAAYLAGLGPDGLSAGVVATNRQAVHAYAQEVAKTVTSTHTRILRTVEDAYRAVISETAGGVVTGAETRRQAAARALDRFATRGVTGFVDTAGRSWRLESYTEMATRTAVGQAHVQGGLDRFQADGRNLVIVSDAPEECVLCRPFEGKVLSLTGTPPTADDLAGGFEYAGTLTEAMVAGLLHPNCRHAINAFVPGLTERFGTTEDPEGDAQRQRQRALERAVRESKRRVAAVEPVGDPQATARARALLRERQERLRVFVAENDRKRLRYREQISGAI